MRILKIIITSLLIGIALTATAQSGNVDKRMKQLEKDKAKREKEKQKIEEKGKKRVYKIQSKDTRKRMKKHKRQANRNATKRVKLPRFVPPTYLLNPVIFLKPEDEK